MRFCLTLMFLLALGVPVLAGGTFTVTEAQYIVISGNTSDTLGRTMITPDSIRIVVSDSAGTELFDAWFESADAQCALNGDIITFFDQWEDINGAASTGVFSIVATVASDADNDIDLFSNQNYVVIGVDEKVEDTYNEIGDILDTLQLHDDWVATEATAAKALDSLADILDSLESHDDWVAQEAGEIADILDTLQNQDDWIATAAEVAKIIDSLADILDSLETQSTWIQDSLYALLDTVQLQDDWVATEATATKALDSLADVLDTLELYDTRFDSLLAALADANVNDKVWVDGTPTIRAQITEARDTLNTYDNAGRFQEDADLVKRVIANTILTIDGATPSVSGFSATELTQADNYWNDQMIMFLTGNVAGQVARITDFTAATDSITLTPNLTTAPASGDSVIILSLFYEAASASLSDADMGAIADSVWDKIYADMVAQAGGAGDSLWAILNDLLDTLQNYDNWVATEVTAAKALDSLADILDTLESHDDWIAAATEVAKAIDSLADVLDSLETISTWLQDSLYGVIDSLQNFPARVDLIWDEDTTGHKTDPQMGFWITQGGEASLSDADMAAIADTVWQADTLNHNAVAGSFGEFLYKPQSASLTDADMGAIGDTVWDKAKADVYAVSEGAGDFFRDTLLAIIDSLQNHDDWVATEVTAAKALDSLADVLDSLETQSTWIQDSLYAIIDTLQLYDGRYALAAELTKAIDSINAVLDTLQLQDGWVATEVTAAKALDSLADILDSLESHDDWIAAAGELTKATDSINALLDTLQLWDTRIDSIEAALADGSIGDKVWTDAGTRTITAGVLTASEWEKVWYAIDTNNIDTSEIGEWFTTGISASISNANIGKIADSTDSILSDAHGPGAWTTGTGSGDNDVRIYAIDTSGTDDSIRNVNITVKTIAGVYDISGHTNSNGYRDFTLPTDSMKYLGSRLGYRWITDTISVTGGDTVDIYGYNIPIDAPDDPNLCRVYGYVYVPEGKPHRTIKVTFTVVGEAVHNSCDSTAFIAEPVPVWTSIHADSLGFFYIDLIPSGCLIDSDSDSLQYEITTELRGVTGKKDLYWIPQEESYEVDW